MEERIIEDEGRTIKVKRNALGGIEDATDGALPEGGAAEGASSPDAGSGGTQEDVEFAVDFPEEEYDEDMVGLTPSQLKRAQEERERARREAEEARDKLIAEGKKGAFLPRLCRRGKFFSQALTYDGESAEALLGVWESRTQGFTDDSPFFIEENAEKFAGMPEEVRSSILERVGSRLQDARQGILEEMRPLKAAVEEAREARRGALDANKRYYLVRTAAFGIAAVLFLALMGVFSAFLLRTSGSWPAVCMAVFGGLALLCLIFLVVFLRGLVFALRLSHDNEKNEGTEDGRRLALLEREEHCLRLVLEGEEEPAFDEES